MRPSPAPRPEHLHSWNVRIILACCFGLSLCAASAGKPEGLTYYQQGQYEKALEELNGEALLGDKEAQRLMGLMHLKGQGTEKNGYLAAHWFAEAAKQGDVISQTYLAEMYFSGNGVAQDDHTAMYSAREAAAQGYAPAQVLLGKMYLEGRATERDPQAAFIEFNRAAEQNNAEAQYQLAQLLERGEGIARDMVQALKWYRVAAALGYKGAIEALQRLNAAPAPAQAIPATPAPTPQATIPTTQQTTTQKKRVALLIANQDYQDNTLDLNGPINDAKLIQASLQKANFNVTLKTNLNQKEMNRTLADFLDSVDSNTVSLVYYSGHGVEINGKNYLIPTDFKMNTTLSADEATRQSLDVARQYAFMTAQAEGSLNIIILDACRDNPFKTRGLRSASAQGGLNAATLPAGAGDGTIETFTAYAAESGQVANDTDREMKDHGPYAVVLAQQLTVVGLELDAVFRRVRLEVWSRTNKQQAPTISAARSSEFFFIPPK